MRMHGALVRFVTDGDPGWERFENGRNPVMIFDEPSEVRENPLELDVAGRAMHFFGPSAGVSLQPFDLEGRAAVVVRRDEEVVAVVRLDERDGRICHLHTFARPSLAR
jgi:hypothetical protein